VARPSSARCLSGFDKAVQIVPMGAKDSDLVNMATLAAFGIGRSERLPGECGSVRPSAASRRALPIEDALPGLLEALARSGRAVLVAPPAGAGKTTGVPLALLDAPWRGDGDHPRARTAPDRRAGRGDPHGQPARDR